MIKKTVFIFLLSFLSVSAKSQEVECGKNYSSLVVEENSGNILFNTRSEKIIYPASLVKVMTLYLTFEALERKEITLDQELVFSDRGEEISKVNKINTLAVEEGDKITVRQAIQAVIVKSFNETAITLAEAVSGNEWEFVRKMNSKARDLGMDHTSFRNSTGLHEEGQYSNTYDLARLAMAIKKDFPEYYHLFSLKEFSYKGKTYKSHNNILFDYQGSEGMKTGFTNASGYNLISLAKRNNERLLSILIGCQTSKSRDKFAAELFDKGFVEAEKNYKIQVKLLKKFNYEKGN